MAATTSTMIEDRRAQILPVLTPHERERLKRFGTAAHFAKGQSADDYRRWQAARPKLSTWIKQMNDGGVLLVSGTDLTNEWIAPGEGLHQEFEPLEEAGLSPNQILRMTGANAAEALHRSDVGLSRQAGARISCCFRPILVSQSQTPVRSYGLCRAVA